MPSLLQKIPAMGARRTLGGTSPGVHQTIHYLASGHTPRELSSAAFAVGPIWGGAMRGALQGRRHAKDGLAFLRVAAAAVEEASLLLDRAGALAQQAQSPTASEIDRSNQDAAYQSILAILDTMPAGSRFNGECIFGETPIHIPLGEAGGLDIQLGILDLTLVGDLRSASSAQLALEHIGSLRATLTRLRAGLESGTQRLTALANTFGVQGQNLAAAQSQMRDAQLADGVVNLTKFQILNHSGSSPLGATPFEACSLLALLQ